MEEELCRYQDLFETLFFVVSFYSHIKDVCIVITSFAIDVMKSLHFSYHFCNLIKILIIFILFKFFKKHNHIPNI